MKFEITEIWGFEHAIRGMRNPKESWNKSDSVFGIDNDEENVVRRIPDGNSFEILSRDGDAFTFVSIGKNDMKLAQALIRGGSEHRKFLRQIMVSVDITAPLYWWKEFDTYKIGTVANSTSTMHKIYSKPITIDCFETDDYCANLTMIDPTALNTRISGLVDDLEQLRQKHLLYLKKSKNDALSSAERKHCERIAKRYWKELIRWLPESWLQTRTVTFNYENLFAMCGKGQRRYHKLSEWSDIDNDNVPSFIEWARNLPYAQELIFLDELEEQKFLINEESMKKIRETVLKITNNQIDIMLDENNFKPVYQVLEEVGQVFNLCE